MAVSLPRASGALVLWLSLAACVFGAPLLWYLFQQGVGSAVYADCHLTPFPRVLRLAGLAIGAAVTVGSVALGALAWQIQGRAGLTPAQHFLARIGTGIAAIFVLGSLAVTAALALVPPCE